MDRERREVVLYEAALEPVPDAGPLTHIEGRALPYDVWTNRGWFMESVAVRLAGQVDPRSGRRSAAAAVP